MAKKYISDFTGGLNDVTREDLLADNEIQQCVNYEIDGTGNLVKRKQSETFDPLLDSLISEVFGLDDGGTLLSIAPPFFPSIKLEDQDSDYFLFIFGQNASGQFVLHGFYKKTSGDNPWSYQYTDSEGNEQDLLYSYKKRFSTFSENFLNFDTGSDRLIFTNGSNDNGYFYVNPSQVPTSGTLGYGPPLNPPIIKPLKNDNNNRGKYESNNFTDDPNIVNAGSPGYIQVSYTFVTKDGFESNPSPASRVADYYFNLRDSDNNNSLFLRQFEVSNLSIPYYLGEQFINEAKYFNIYARVFDSRKSLASKNFEFIEQVPIISKSLWGTNQDNTYTINKSITPGSTIDYEADSSPVSEHVATTGGVTFLANLKSSISFPSIDSHYHTPIGITNNNEETFIDAPVHIRVWDTGGIPPAGTNKISDLNWIPYFTSNQSTNTSDLRADRKMSPYALEKIRVIGQDMVSPLNCSYKRGDLTSSGQRFVDIMVNIPQLTSGENTVYLCFNNLDKDNNPSPNAGVSYPVRVDSLKETRDVLKYLTEGSVKYELLKELEQQFLDNNVNNNLLEEISQSLYSHDWVNSHDQYETYIHDIAPLYKFGQWVCGEDIAECAVLKDLAVQDYNWGASTLLTCNGDTYINNNVFGEDEQGFVNKAYMNYGGWKRPDPPGVYDYSRYQEGTDNFKDNELGPSYYDGGRVIARDEANGSFWSGIPNDDDGPGRAVRVGQAIRLKNNQRSNCAFGNFGFGPSDFNNDGFGALQAKFTLFFHLSFDNPWLDNGGYQESIANERVMTNKGPTHVDINNVGDSIDDGTGYPIANNGKGAFYKEWEFWRNVFSVRTVARHEDILDEEGKLLGEFGPLSRLRFGMMLGKSSSITNKHPFLGAYKYDRGTYNWQFDGDLHAQESRGREAQANSIGDADWLDTHKCLWTLYLSDGLEASESLKWSSDGSYDGDLLGGDFPDNFTYAGIPAQSFWPLTNVICYTGKHNYNDQKAGMTNDNSDPMDAQCQPGVWENRKYNYLVALSFKDSETDVEGADTSLFVCNTAGVEPFADTVNIADGDGKLYCPSDWREVKNIKITSPGDVGDDDVGVNSATKMQAFLKGIIVKDGFNFGASIGDEFSMDIKDSPSMYGVEWNTDERKYNFTSQVRCANNQSYSNMHIEWGTYLNPEEEDIQDAFNMMAYGFHFMKKPVGYVPAKRNLSIDAIHNKDVTFGDSFTSTSVLNNRTVRWSNLGGLTFPDLNYKIVKEPILALMPAPSFLQQEYQNCMLVFTRNMVYRFVLKDQPTGWAVLTDNLIEEYNQYGLFAPKSLVKAGNALFWLSEVGIVKYDSSGLRIINKNKVSVKLNSNAVGFYNPINNQYILTYV